MKTRAQLVLVALVLAVVSVCSAARAETCSFSPAITASEPDLIPYPTHLLAGATMQMLRLFGTDACKNKVRVGAQLRLTNGSKVVQAAVTDVTGKDVTLKLTNVSTSVDSGDWTLGPDTAGGLVAGSVKLEVIREPIRVIPDQQSPPALDVHYRVKTGRVELDNRHGQRSLDGQAVVTPVQGIYKQYVENVATVNARELTSLVNELTAWQARQWPVVSSQPVNARRPSNPRQSQDEFCHAEQNTCADLERKMEDCPDDELNAGEEYLLETCRTHLRVWRVRALTWDDGTQLFEGGYWYGEKAVRPEALSQITFATFRSQSAPFDVEVSLVATETDASEKVVFSTQLRLASGARGESLPLPLARALYVQCGDSSQRGGGVFPLAVADGPGVDVVKNGGTRAVNDEDLATGACRIRYSPRMLFEAFQLADNDESRDLLKYYGPQLIRITVTHGDTPEQTRDAPIDPSVDSDIYLPTLGPVKGNSVYTISVKPLAPLPPAVFYRGQARAADATAAAASTELEFRANLRPRGPYGWQRAPLRMFATFPLNVTGVRFPAAPADLSKSSQPPGAQVLPLAVGVLFAVEPWNYDTGRNLWAVPLRFATGMNIYDISHGAFAPSWLTGVSVTLPIINLQKGVAEDQLGTDLAAGIFWEVDFREQQPLKYGNHLLLTFGFNVLSLFGSR